MRTSHIPRFPMTELRLKLTLGVALVAYGTAVVGIALFGSEQVLMWGAAVAVLMFVSLFFPTGPEPIVYINGRDIGWREAARLRRKSG